MFGDEKNLKDSHQNFSQSSTQNSTSDTPVISLKDSGQTISYTKTNKLITALYMVTDIMDKDEPLRNKLRTLGIEIISDTSTSLTNALSKIHELVSFLEVATAVNIISVMNSNILKKEFKELNNSILESLKGSRRFASDIDLSDLFKNDLPDASHTLENRGYQSIGRPVLNRIGVQKGSTLLKALSDRTSMMSDRKSVSKSSENFDVLKKQRRLDIVAFISRNGGSATITDIRSNAGGSIGQTGEKTLQRELLSMQKDGVLNKTGEKRWSRYFLT
jgi:DNA-binding HxlR family transcriptional regulator